MNCTNYSDLEELSAFKKDRPKQGGVDILNQATILYTSKILKLFYFLNFENFTSILNYDVNIILILKFKI